MRYTHSAHKSTKYSSMVAVVALWLCSPSPLAAAGTNQVDLELVLAVDISGSIDADEAKLQREGYAKALTAPQTLAAIADGPTGQIAVTYIEWSGSTLQHTVVPWRVINSASSAAEFVAVLQQAPYVTGRWTSISGAMDYSATQFMISNYDSPRKIIDISGDGYNNSGRQIRSARDDVLAKGITINGLPIINDRPNPWGGQTPRDLDRYYETEVIGGPGSFIIVANGFHEFAQAIQAKLIQEIAARGDVGRPTQKYQGWFSHNSLEGE